MDILKHLYVSGYSYNTTLEGGCQGMKELETGEVIITQGDLQKRIAELGKSISEDYKGRDPVLICVLKGAVVFMADLIRTVPIPFVIDFLSISSYGAGKGEAGAVRIIKDLDIDIAT